MKSVEFCYWLQGLFELGEPKSLNEKQTELIRRHLSMVFSHEIDRRYPPEEQSVLEALHSGASAVLSPEPVRPVVPMRPEPLPYEPWNDQEMPKPMC